MENNREDLKIDIVMFSKKLERLLANKVKIINHNKTKLIIQKNQITLQENVSLGYRFFLLFLHNLNLENKVEEITIVFID